MKCAISVVVLCVLMFQVSNIVKIVKANVLDMCRWHGRYPGKCGPRRCHNEVKSPHNFERCECDNIIVQRKDYHNCDCYIKPPCHPN
ncbi:hypothetical protein YC2023_110306 [Brassica napus]